MVRRFGMHRSRLVWKGHIGQGESAAAEELERARLRHIRDDAREKFRRVRRLDEALIRRYRRREREE